MSHRYLMRRGNTYYARIILSQQDQETLGRKELWRSLRVFTLKEAVEKLALLQYTFTSDKVGFLVAKSDTLDVEEIALLSDEYGKRVFNQFINSGESEVNSLAGDLYGSMFDPFDSEKNLAREIPLEELPNIVPKSTLQEYAASLNVVITRRNKELIYGYYERIEQILIETFKGIKTYEFPKKDGDKFQKGCYRGLCESFLKAEINAIEHYKKAVAESKTGHLTPLKTTSYDQLLGEVSAAPARKKSKTFGELIAAYNAAPENSNKTANIVENLSGYQKLLLDLIGTGTAIDSINTGTTREVYAALEILPKNALKKYQGKTYREVQEIEKAKPSELPRMSPKTKREYLQHLRSLMEWALREGWVAANPVGKNFRFRTDPASALTRAPFSDHDLAKLFNRDALPVYRETPVSERYWVPLLGLFTGMRLSEALMLTLDEIKIDEKIPFFDLTPNEERGLKTGQSARQIPIPEILIKLGFLDFVSSVDARQRTLFRISDVKNFPDAFGKWFGRDIGKLGVTDANKVFHSFRHNFRDGARHAELLPVDAQIANQLGGWMSHEVHEQYGSGFTLKQKKRVIDAVTNKGMGAACKIVLAGSMAEPKPESKLFKKAPEKR